MRDAAAVTPAHVIICEQGNAVPKCGAAAVTSVHVIFAEEALQFSSAMQLQ